MTSWYVYIVRCKDNSLYTGMAVDVKRRFKEHQEGSKKSAKYLRGRGPLFLVWKKKIGDRSRAQSLEYRIKTLSKDTKEALIEGHLKLGDVIEWK